MCLETWLGIKPEQSVREPCLAYRTLYTSWQSPQGETLLPHTFALCNGMSQTQFPREIGKELKYIFNYQCYKNTSNCWEPCIHKPCTNIKSAMTNVNISSTQNIKWQYITQITIIVRKYFTQSSLICTQMWENKCLMKAVWSHNGQYNRARVDMVDG